jgi:hypothetical protein
VLIIPLLIEPQAVEGPRRVGRRPCLLLEDSIRRLLRVICLQTLLWQLAFREADESLLDAELTLQSSTKATDSRRLDEIELCKGYVGHD